MLAPSLRRPVTEPRKRRMASVKEKEIPAEDAEGARRGAAETAGTARTAASAVARTTFESGEQLMRRLLGRGDPGRPLRPRGHLFRENSVGIRSGIIYWENHQGRISRQGA
jgi:hypothetical protein